MCRSSVTKETVIARLDGRYMSAACTFVVLSVNSRLTCSDVVLEFNHIRESDASAYFWDSDVGSEWVASATSLV